MRLLVSLIFLIATQLSFGQNRSAKDRLISRAKKMDLTLNLPDGFEEINGPDSLFSTTSGETYLPAMSYKLQSIRRNVLLGFSLYDERQKGFIGTPNYTYYPYNQLLVLRSLLGESPISDNVSIKTLNMAFDTTKVKFFNDDLLEVYHATYGGVADIPLHRPYRGLYKRLKVLFLYKLGYGETYQFYFYNDKREVEAVLNKTLSVITFAKVN